MSMQHSEWANFHYHLSEFVACFGRSVLLLLDCDQYPNLKVVQVELQQHEHSQRELRADAQQLEKHGTFLRHAGIFLRHPHLDFFLLSCFFFVFPWILPGFKETKLFVFIFIGGRRGSRGSLEISGCCQHYRRGIQVR